MMKRDLRFYRRVFIRIHDYFKPSCLNRDVFIFKRILAALRLCVRFHDGKASAAFLFMFSYRVGKRGRESTSFFLLFLFAYKMMRQKDLFVKRMGRQESYDG